MTELPCKGDESAEERDEMSIARSKGHLRRNRHHMWIYAAFPSESFWASTPVDAIRAAVALRGAKANPSEARDYRPGVAY